MEAGDCPALNMNALHNYLLSHSLSGITSYIVIRKVTYFTTCGQLEMHSHRQEAREVISLTQSGLINHDYFFIGIMFPMLVLELYSQRYLQPYHSE